MVPYYLLILFLSTFYLARQMSDGCTQVSCIILAGGAGKRAGGKDKGLIHYKNKPLIEHVIDKVTPQVDEIIISANRNQIFYKKYTDVVIGDSTDTYQGPLAGIAACLKYCSHKQVLIVACDMPLLPDDLVKQLSQHIKNNKACFATVKDNHQLALLIKDISADSIQDRIENKQLKFIEWVKSIPYASVSFDDSAEAFLNLNAISDN